MGEGVGTKGVVAVTHIQSHIRLCFCAITYKYTYTHKEHTYNYIRTHNKYLSDTQRTPLRRTHTLHSLFRPKTHRTMNNITVIGDHHTPTTPHSTPTSTHPIPHSATTEPHTSYTHTITHTEKCTHTITSTLLWHKEGETNEA